MDSLENLALRLSEKVDALIAKNQQLREENEALKQRYHEKVQWIENQQNAVAEIEEQNKLLKIAKHLSGSNSDTRALKLKINELVRDIDKCIAGLND